MITRSGCQLLICIQVAAVNFLMQLGSISHDFVWTYIYSLLFAEASWIHYEWLAHQYHASCLICSTVGVIMRIIVSRFLFHLSGLEMFGCVNKNSNQRDINNTLNEWTLFQVHVILKLTFLFQQYTTLSCQVLVKQGSLESVCDHATGKSFNTLFSSRTPTG